MNWEEVGAIGQVLGSIAVFVTLAYLARQIPVAALMERAGLTIEEAVCVNNINTAWWTYHLQIIPYVDELTAMARTGFENRIRAAYGWPGANHLFYETYLKTTAHPVRTPFAR
jgi:hypothetical protein